MHIMQMISNLILVRIQLSRHCFGTYLYVILYLYNARYVHLHRLCVAECRWSAVRGAHTQSEARHTAARATTTATKAYRRVRHKAPQ